MSREQIDEGKAWLEATITQLARETGIALERMVWRDMSDQRRHGYAMLSVVSYGREHRERFWNDELRDHTSPSEQLKLRHVVRQLLLRARVVA